MSIWSPDEPSVPLRGSKSTLNSNRSFSPAPPTMPRLTMLTRNEGFPPEAIGSKRGIVVRSRPRSAESPCELTGFDQGSPRNTQGTSVSSGCSFLPTSRT